jgi:cell division protein FtsL
MTQNHRQFVSTRKRQLATASPNGATWGRNQNLTPFASGTKLGPIANVVLIILLIAFLGLLYLTQLTKTSTFGYEMNEINVEKSQLAAEQDDLKIESARLQSLTRVQDSAVAAAMATPVDSSYME